MKALPLVSGATALALSLAVQSALAQTPSVEELWKLVQQQQQQIEALRAELEATRQQGADAERKIAATEQRIEAAELRVEETDAVLEEVATRPVTSSWAERTHLGGYGELHYNAGDKDEIDFHRFVLFFGHEFNEDVRFQGELEVEHSLAGAGKPGEVEVEQAYIEFDISDTLRAKGGLFLVPVGFLNETHEPPTFYGVERNPVESSIIPTTWWEAGAALTGEFAPGWSFDAAVHSGLETGPGSNYAVRSGRQKVASALAKDPAFTGRVRYTGIAGLELGATVNYQEDITQGQDPLAGSATLLEAHAAWQVRGFGLKALFARWELDGEGPEAVGADVQDGWFVEPSYRINEQFGVFARYNRWNNLSGRNGADAWRQTDFGVSYWPHPRVVVKADYQWQDAPTGKNGDDRINLGIGYQF